MKEIITEIIQYRHLLFMFARRDIKVRYKQSVMGFLWALFMPMMIVTAGILVRKAFSMLSGNPMDIREIASVSVKAIPWAFFVASIRYATNSITGNMDLVTKIYFPREVFPISATLANLFDFAVASILLIVILFFGKIGVSVYLLWIPIIILLLIMITVGIGMFLACANVLFRDVKYIVEVILTFGIFFTPVFYEAKMLGKWEPVLLLNPIGAILEAINDVVVLRQAPNLYWVGYSAIWAIGGLLLAWTIFHKAEFTFAENI